MELLVRAYNDFKYDALNVGINDLALGVTFLQQFEKEATFPFLSANVSTNTGKLIFQPYTIVKKDGLRIGIVGVTNGNNNLPEIQYKDVVETARQMQSRLAEKTDFLVLLASVYNPDADRLKQSNLAYDLIIRSHTSRFSRYPRTVGDKQSADGFFIETGKEGKSLHFVNFHRENPNATVVDISRKKQRLSFIQQRLNQLKEKAKGESLQEAYAGSQATLDFIKDLQDQSNGLKSEIENAQNYIALDIQSLGAQVADNEKWLKAVNRYMAYEDSVKNSLR